MNKKMFLFAMTCNLFAPPKGKVVRDVTEWQDPPEDIRNHQDYINSFRVKKGRGTSPTRCILEANRIVMLNDQGQVRDCTDEELERLPVDLKTLRGVK